MADHIAKNDTAQLKLDRRAKREARRAKQRGINIKRAEKMHCARRDHAPAAKVQPSVNIQKFHVGCSGWFYWHWRGTFYPATVPTKNWFAHYAGKFKTVELNAPFYAWPTVATVESWVRQAGKKRFVYTVKVCELITHIKRMSNTKRLVQDFGHIADLLGPRMGCFLFQFPPSFRYTPGRLKAIVNQLDPSRRNVVEFRHRSWWDERVYAALRENQIIFCSSSGPRLPDELIKTADEIYIRFHGIEQWYRHNYTKAELAVWVDRIHQSGAKRVWAYFNNDRDGYAIANARELLRQLEASQI